MRPSTRLPRGSDLALLHVLVVLAVFAALQLQPDRDQVAFVQDSSTNVANLRRFPFRVLLLSSIVVPDPVGLLILVPLAVVLTAVQRWLERVATLLAFGFGHVGATLVVALVLVSGLTRGRLDPAVAHAPDVGVSYGLVGLVGLLTARVPRRVRLPFALVPLVALGAVLAVSPDFTALGHLVALGVGFGLALIVTRAAAPR